MKKIVIVGIIVFLLAGVSFAGEEEKVTGSVTSKNDFVWAPEGKARFTETVSAYWQYKRLGGGIDVIMDPKNDFFHTEPYLTLNKGSWYVLGGLAINSSGGRWAQTGAWYINKFGRFNLTIDVRNYWGLDKESISFLDSFAEVTYNLGKKFFTGLDLEYRHWWRGENHNWYFVGPLLGYNISKNLSIFVRPSREWDILGGDAKHTDKIRVGLKFCF